MAEQVANYVAIRVASERTGIPGRTLRHWVVRGKIAAIHGNTGKLVRLDDVERLAEMVGKEHGKGDDENGEVGKKDGIADEVAANLATSLAPSPNAQLTAIMDQWLLPLVERIGDLERENGHLTAERDALQRRVEALETAQVLDDLRSLGSLHSAPGGVSGRSRDR